MDGGRGRDLLAVFFPNSLHAGYFHAFVFVMKQ